MKTEVAASGLQKQKGLESSLISVSFVIEKIISKDSGLANGLLKGEIILNNVSWVLHIFEGVLL